LHSSSVPACYFSIDLTHNKAQVWTCTYFQERTHLETGRVLFCVYLLPNFGVISESCHIKNEKRSADDEKSATEANFT